MKTKLYLFDIEGTTTDIHFVHEVLFPYSKERMKEFVLEHREDPQVASAIEKVKETVYGEEQLQITNYEVVNVLEKWIEQDRKHPALKEIQGLIWDRAYKEKHFEGHVYPDVKPFFEKITKSGKKVGIYSSGSVHAQKLIMGHSQEGDLTPMISYYFDTKVGGKRDPSSYKKIAQETGLKPEEIHFFSDVPEELQAAKAAGMQVTQLLRPGTPPSDFPTIKDFSQHAL